MKPIRIPIPARTTSTKLDALAGRITWYSFAETTGAAPAQIQVIDGNDATGSLVMLVNLLANESTREYTGHHGIPYLGGLYLNVLSGSVAGSVVCVAEEYWVDWWHILQAIDAGNAQ